MQQSKLMILSAGIGMALSAELYPLQGLTFSLMSMSMQATCWARMLMHKPLQIF
jgi:hypothetical protein